MSIPWVEWIGYGASGLVVLSFAMSSVVRLRIVSFTGSVIFVVYGCLLPSIPVVITNLAVALVNMYYLRKEFAPNRDLGAVPIALNAPFLADFLRAHASDIAKFHPDFVLADANAAWLLTRDGLPAGVLLGNLDGAELTVHLDYVTPAYRDSRLGHWLYGAGAKALEDKGIRAIVVPSPTAAVRSYFQGVGFSAAGTNLVRTLG